MMLKVLRSRTVIITWAATGVDMASLQRMRHHGQAFLCKDMCTPPLPNLLVVKLMMAFEAA
eukprot:1441997-Amphidinium_carterae.1